ncbi:MAG TPA: GatB/YqeY domain-containing protein [Candidatus Limnocylindria bacterium]|nr:GatB/YqeY domain-containing protein [Candidatus Limnocylindria bacterium]
MSEPSILQRIQTDLTAAMKAQDAETLSTLRMLKAALMEAKTKKPKDATLSADEQIEVVQRYAKKRREAIDELRRVGREDLVAREEREIEVTGRYLPQSMSESELRAVVQAAVASTGAAEPKDMGRVIGAVMAQVKGRAEGGIVSRLVKEALGG